MEFLWFQTQIAVQLLLIIFTVLSFKYKTFQNPILLEGFQTFEFCLHFKVILLSLLFRFVYYCTAVQQQMDVDFSIEMPEKKKEIFCHFHFIPFSMYLLNK